MATTAQLKERRKKEKAEREATGISRGEQDEARKEKRRANIAGEREFIPAEPQKPRQPAAAEQAGIIDQPTPTGATGEGGDFTVSGKGEQTLLDKAREEVIGEGLPTVDDAFMALGGVSVGGGIKKELTKRVGSKTANTVVNMGSKGREMMAGGVSGNLAKIAAGDAGGVVKKGITNTKQATLIKNHLWNLVKALKNPFVVLGIVGTTLYTSLFWGPNEKGDSLVTLTIAQRDAVDAEDWELVAEIDQAIQEAYNISANVPVVGFGQAELAKFDAALSASEASMAKAEKARKDAEKRETDRLAQEARDRKFQEQQDERIAHEQAQQEAFQRAQDERLAHEEQQQRHFEELQARKELASEQEQAHYEEMMREQERIDKETQEFWAEYQKEKDRQRIEEEKKRLDSLKSNLRFGLL